MAPPARALCLLCVGQGVRGCQAVLSHQVPPCPLPPPGFPVVLGPGMGAQGEPQTHMEEGESAAWLGQGCLPERCSKLLEPASHHEPGWNAGAPE